MISLHPLTLSSRKIQEEKTAIFVFYWYLYIVFREYVKCVNTRLLAKTVHAHSVVIRFDQFCIDCVVRLRLLTI